MGYKLDIAGQKYGKLTAIEPTAKRNKDGNVIWKFACDCGSTLYTAARDVKRGNTKSCGCSRNKPNPKRRKHFGIGIDSKLYHVWSDMKTRCSNPRIGYAYTRYGGRGIKVCDQWKESFEAFKDWAIVSGYAEGLTIDRIDNDGNYEPGNCRWATRSEQARNRHKKGETNGDSLQTTYEP